MKRVGGLADPELVQHRVIVMRRAKNDRSFWSASSAP